MTQRCYATSNGITATAVATIAETAVVAARTEIAIAATIVAGGGAIAAANTITELL